MASVAESLGRAIARMEGYYTPGTISARNKNPGNLRGGRRQIGVDSTGYGIYQSDSDGWADLIDQINRNIGRGLNLNEFFAGKPGVYAGYAPSADNNDPANYARFVSRETGIPPDVSLASLPAAAASGAASPNLTSAADLVASPNLASGDRAAGAGNNPLLDVAAAARGQFEGPGWLWPAVAVAVGAVLYFWWE